MYSIVCTNKMFSRYFYRTYLIQNIQFQNETWATKPRHIGNKENVMRVCNKHTPKRCLRNKQETNW